MNWKKLLRWTAMVIGVVILVLVGGGFVVLKTSWFHHHVLAHIMEEGQTATGGKLDVQDWDVHVSPLRADLYGVVLHGTESVNAKPLLQIQELTVGISASSLLHRKLQLTELLIKNPIANVQVANNGTNNLPTPPPAKTSRILTCGLSRLDTHCSAMGRFITTTKKVSSMLICIS